MGRGIWGVKVHGRMICAVTQRSLTSLLEFLRTNCQHNPPFTSTYRVLRALASWRLVRKVATTIIVKFFKHSKHVKKTSQINNNAPKSASQGWGATLECSALPWSHSGVLWCLDSHIAILMQCSFSNGHIGWWCLHSAGIHLIVSCGACNPFKWMKCCRFMMIYVCRFVAASGRILIHDYDSVCFCYSTSAIYSDCWSFPHTFANVWASVWLPLNKAWIAPRIAE